MSYNAVGFIPLVVGGAAAITIGANMAGAAPQCDGGLMDNQGEECCESSTWSNLSYLEALGDNSFQHQNEKRVRFALSWLLIPGNLAAVAGDAPAALPSDLLPAIQKASSNFNRLFPEGRWFKEPGAVHHSCAGDAGWSAWNQRFTVFRPETEALIKQLAIGKETPEAWHQKAHSEITWVPGGRAGQSWMAMPRPDELYTISEGKVMASDWLARFILSFVSFDNQPRLRIGSLSAPKPKPRLVQVGPIPRLVLARPGTQDSVPATSADETATPGMSTGTKVAIGVGVLAAVGGVAYVATR